MASTQRDVFTDPQEPRAPVIDLHLHSWFSSDGDHSPQELLALARDAGVSVVSITDHDSAEGSRVAMEHAHAYGVDVVPAVELTTFYEGVELHVLAYYVDIDHPSVIDTLASIQAADEDRARDSVEALRRLGIDVTFDEARALKPHAPPKGSVIVRAAMTNGRNDDAEIFRAYRSGSRKNQPYHNFFLDNMRPGGVAYVAPSRLIATPVAIELVLDNGGVPVLAHPSGSLQGRNEFEVVDRLTAFGLCGVEAFSSYHSTTDTARWVDYCSTRGLAVTTGSDFHGETVKPGLALGGPPNAGALKSLEERRRTLHGR